MKHILSVLLMVVFSTQVFAQKKDFPKGYDVLNKETIQKLQERRTLLRSWAPKCADGSLTMENCPFWDAVEYMGMLCLSGETDYCGPVKDSQDPVTGRWFRSPGYKLKPNEFPNAETFSRDMLRGVLAYVVATQDKEAMVKFMDYIQSNQNRLCPKPVEGKWDACRMGLGSWNSFAELYDWFGLEREKKMKGYKFLIAHVYDPIEAMFQPKTFEMILTAESVYTRRKMKEMGAHIRNQGANDRVARIIYRRVPENGFYEYLAKGPTESAAAKILKMCPTEKPIVPISGEGNPQYTEPANGPWEQGSGHYCIFMINALLGSAQ